MTEVVQPDLLFIAKERSHIITDKNIVEAPDLVAEITSKSTKIRDQTTKKAFYAKHGVKEYWIVYPNKKEIEQFMLHDNKTYKTKSILTQSDTLYSEIISGFSTALENVFIS